MMQKPDFHASQKEPKSKLLLCRAEQEYIIKRFSNVTFVLSWHQNCIWSRFELILCDQDNLLACLDILHTSLFTLLSPFDQVRDITLYDYHAECESRKTTLHSKNPVNPRFLSSSEILSSSNLNFLSSEEEEH